MTNHKDIMTLVPLCVLIAFATGAAGWTTKSDDRKILLDLGPLKLALAHEVTSDTDKLEFNKLEWNLLFGFNSDKADRLAVRGSRREELIRCSELLDKHPEMDLLIDCKPLYEHLAERKLPPRSDSGRLDKYVKRLVYAGEKEKEWELPFWNIDHFGCHFHPLEPDHSRASIERILSDHNMARVDLNFSAMSKNLGFLVTSEVTYLDSLAATCRANLFIIVNQTEALSPDEADGSVSMYDSLTSLAIENGAFVSVQDASCSLGGLMGSVDSELTFIYRKQFPYIFYNHSSKFEPFESLWASRASIKQTRGDDDSLAPNTYNTSIEMLAASKMFNGLNFMFTYNISNSDLFSGIDLGWFMHPSQALTVIGDWKADFLSKTIRGYPSHSVVGLLNGDSATLEDPNFTLKFHDDPEDSDVALTLEISRATVRPLLELLGYYAKTPKKATLYRVHVDSLPDELQTQFKDFVDSITGHAIREEL